MRFSSWRFPLLVVGLLILGAWFANSWLLPMQTDRGSAFSMPDLRGMTRTEAYSLCSRHEMVVSELPAEFDPVLPSGFVIRQIPASNRQVKPGRRVSIVISAGPKSVALPELRGMTERQARLSLEDLGLGTGDIIHCSGDEVAGRVLGTRPGAGQRVRDGVNVDLLLSKGATPGIWLVPDLRGQDLEVALALIDAARILPPRVRYRRGSPEGGILEQSPEPGLRLREGEELELVVATGS